MSEGLAGHVIVETTRQTHAQLIVLAASPGKPMLPGTVSQYVLYKADCPVMLVPSSSSAGHQERPQAGAVHERDPGQVEQQRRAVPAHHRQHHVPNVSATLVSTSPLAHTTALLSPGQTCSVRAIASPSPQAPAAGRSPPIPLIDPRLEKADRCRIPHLDSPARWDNEPVQPSGRGMRPARRSGWSGDEREEVQPVVTTVSPRPVQCRSGEPNDRELFGRVYRQARCATSCLEPDEWFPLTADVGRAPGTGRPGHRDLRRVSSAGGLPGAFAPALFRHRRARSVGRPGRRGTPGVAAPPAGRSVQSLKTARRSCPAGSSPW